MSTHGFWTSYLVKLARRYGLNLKGRALKTYKPLIMRQPFKRILEESKPCKLLSGIYHFHVDLYGNFIPQSCPGFSVPLKELVHGADPGKYRVFYSLESVGIRGLVELAEKEYEYAPKTEYAGKCDLCYDIRNHLVLELGLDLPDLKPEGHYKYLNTYLPNNTSSYLQNFWGKFKKIGGFRRHSYFIILHQVFINIRGYRFYVA